MIYLIGGAPRCGKSILSKKLAVQKNCSWISTDTIRQMVLASTPKTEWDAKFPYEKLQLGAEPYTDMSQNEFDVLLRAEITESESIWPSVQAMIKHLIETKQDFIIEGVHLMPGLVQQLKDTSSWEQIRLVYLVKTDMLEIKDGFVRNTSEHDWLSGALDNKELLKRVAEMVLTKSLYISEQAKRDGFTVVDMGKDFEGELARLLQEF